MNEIDITAIIPVYNDRVALEYALQRSIAMLAAISPKFELLIAEDGSTDGSAEFARQAERQDSRIHLIHNDERLGRGAALTRVMGIARGGIACYYDVDLATDLTYLQELVRYIRNGYDIATGSRLLPTSSVVRSGKREIPSRVYNWLVRLILGSTLHDHQCGFKAFNRQHVVPLLTKVHARHWFWDTEILVRAQKSGMRVIEFPVKWQEGKHTTVKIKDVIRMGGAIVSLWWDLHVSKN